MKKTNQNPYLRITHDEFKEETIIDCDIFSFHDLKYYYKYQEEYYGLNVTLRHISNKSGDKWTILRDFTDTLVLRCNMKNITIKSSYYDGHNHFELTEQQVELIANSSNVELRAYSGGKIEDLKNTDYNILYRIQKNPIVVAAQFILNSLDNSLYNTEVADYLLQHKNALIAEQEQQQARQVAWENERNESRMFFAVALICAAVAFFGFFYALYKEDDWWIPICGAVGCVVSVVKLLFD